MSALSNGGNYDVCSCSDCRPKIGSGKVYIHKQTGELILYEKTKKVEGWEYFPKGLEFKWQDLIFLSDY